MNAHLAAAAAAPSASTSKKNTVYIAGFAQEVNEQQLLDAFVTFGDILEVSIPTEHDNPKHHRGFAFMTFSNPADAQDAIENMDLNELPGYQGRGKFLKCSLAQPDRFGKEGGKGGYDRAVWHSEEWIKQHDNEQRAAEGISIGAPAAPLGGAGDEDEAP